MSSRGVVFVTCGAALMVLAFAAYMLLRPVPVGPTARNCPATQPAELVMTISPKESASLHGKRHELETVLDGVTRRCSFRTPSEKGECGFTNGSSINVFSLMVAGRPERVAVSLLTDGVVSFEGQRSPLPSIGCPPVIDVPLHAIRR
jgi:hypothetical protein